MHLKITREENIVKVTGELSPKRGNDVKVVIKTADVIGWLKEVHTIDVHAVLGTPTRGYLHNADRENTLKGEWIFALKQEKKVEKVILLKDNINKQVKENKPSASTKKRKSSKT